MQASVAAAHRLSDNSRALKQRLNSVAHGLSWAFQVAQW